MSYVKFCPRCEATTAVDSALCPNCGHQFRTHFQSPVSEKTIAMTAIPTAEAPQPAPTRHVVSERRPRSRPRFRPRLMLIGAAALALLGTIYGVHTRRSQPPIARKGAFQSYDVVIRGDAQGDSAPVATQSPTDLRQWQATRPAQTSQDEANVGDDPARVHLYLSKRIVLVPQGSVGRVVLEQGEWRQIQILDGLYRGTTGFISPDAFVRLEDLAPKTTVARTAAR